LLKERVFSRLNVPLVMLFLKMERVQSFMKRGKDGKMPVKENSFMNGFEIMELCVQVESLKEL
jgi:hypothetical protein